MRVLAQFKLGYRRVSGGASETCEMSSCPPRGVISLASARRDKWLSNDIYLWLQILAHAGPQAPSVHTHKYLVYISESPY